MECLRGATGTDHLQRMALLITFEELQELFDVTIANYHASAHDGLNGRSPLIGH
jgi:hypothetical protein